MNKLLFSLLTLSTLTSTTFAVCSPPSIMVAVGKTKFPVPLFKDCKYGDPGAVIPMSSSPAPAKAKSASADYNRFVDSTGATLNSESMKKLLTFFGKAVSFQLLIQQTICTITDKGMNNRIYTIDDGDGRVDGQDMLDKGREVTVGSYRCVINLR